MQEFILYTLFVLFIFVPLEVLSRRWRNPRKVLRNRVNFWLFLGFSESAVVKKVQHHWSTAAIAKEKNAGKFCTAEVYTKRALQKAS